MVGSDGFRSGVVGVEKVVGDAGRGVAKTGIWLASHVPDPQGMCRRVRRGDDPLQVVRQIPSQ